MCRITGFWDPQEGNEAVWRETLLAMRDSMTYGGPDDAGFYLEQETGLALGHRRLAILDLSPIGPSTYVFFIGPFRDHLQRRGL